VRNDPDSAGSTSLSPSNATGAGAMTDAHLALEEAAARVPARLKELAQIGAMPEGGITRLPFSEVEEQALRLVISWAESAGARVTRDEFGNVFAIRGDWESMPGVMLGSHIDTVPQGGAFDGALGVVAALAVLDAWQHEHPICAVVFRGEEPLISPIGCLGSRVYTDIMPFDETIQLLHKDAQQQGPDLPFLRPALPTAYLELHIEQGRRLERARKQLGAVTGIAGYLRWHVTIRGRADHSGATPMSDRRDALAAAAEIVLAVEAAGKSEIAHETVATIGALEVHPNAVNVVPGKVTLTVDVRSLDDASAARAMKVLQGAAAEACERRGVEVNGEITARVDAIRFPEQVTAAVVRAAARLGTDAVLLPSGAGHDAMNMARVCQTGMIFIPCREGRSHSPEEYATPEACTLGTRALSLAAEDLMRIAGS
jgi:beta-ureidopropionase / N-carbamoyl-L-amino-acid hydrolase